MKIGDEVFVHGYVDEIRNDVVIIRNDGGYFGTVESEVITADTPQTEMPEYAEWKDAYNKMTDCGWK